MKVNFHVSVTVVLQVIGLALQVANAYSAIVPAQDKMAVAAVIAALQGVQGVLAHYQQPPQGPTQLHL